MVFSHLPSERPQDTKRPSADRPISYQNLFREPAFPANGAGDDQDA
jgi:hypothetical protein